MFGPAWLLTTFLAGACADAPVCLVEADAIGLEPTDTEALERAASDALRTAGAAPCPVDRAALTSALPEGCRTDLACRDAALTELGVGGALSLRFVRFGQTLEVASELSLTGVADPLPGRVQTSLEGFLERPRLGEAVEAALVCHTAPEAALSPDAEAPVAAPPLADAAAEPSAIAATPAIPEAPAGLPATETPAAEVPAAAVPDLSPLLLPSGLGVAGVGVALLGAGSVAALVESPVLQDPTSPGSRKELALAIGGTGLAGASLGAVLLTVGGGLALYGLLAPGPQEEVPPRNASTSRP